MNTPSSSLFRLAGVSPRPAVSSAHLPVRQPQFPNHFPEAFDVRTVRSIPGQGKTADNLAAILVKSPKFDSAAELVNNLTEIERRYGTATAFTLGALIAGGVTDPGEIIDNGRKLDQLCGQLADNIKRCGKFPPQQLLGAIKNELWRLAPDRYSPPGHSDNFRLTDALDKYLSGSNEPIGDCVTLTLIDNLVLMKFGFPLGVVLDQRHVFSITPDGQTIENTQVDFFAALARHEAAEVTGRVYNYLGLLALIFNSRGNYLADHADPAAKRCFDLAIGLCPNYATLYNNRANYHVDQAEYAEAARDYQSALALDPRNAYIYMNRAVMYLKQGSEAKAMADLRSAYALEPDNPDFTSIFRQLGLSALSRPGIPR
jgi:tetratricopeptide (TPR) repeat protein